MARIGNNEWDVICLERYVLIRMKNIIWKLFRNTFALAIEFFCNTQMGQVGIFVLLTFENEQDPVIINLNLKCLDKYEFALN